MRRAGIFIDGTNLYFVQKHFLLVEYFRKFYSIYNVFFYLPYKEEDYEHEKFCSMLAFSGITVVRKPVKHLKDGSLKENLDAEVAIVHALNQG